MAAALLWGFMSQLFLSYISALSVKFDAPSVSLLQAEGELKMKLILVTEKS